MIEWPEALLLENGDTAAEEKPPQRRLDGSELVLTVGYICFNDSGSSVAGLALDPSPSTSVYSVLGFISMFAFIIQEWNLVGL